MTALAALSPWCVTQIRDYDLVVLRKWGRRVEGEIPPGLKWYWPVINTVHRYDARPRPIKINEKDETTHLAGIGTQSREGWFVGVSTDIVYTLDRDKWQAVDDNFGSDDTEETRRQIESRIRVSVRSAVQNLMPQYDIEYLLDHRNEMLHNARVVLGISQGAISGTQTIAGPDGNQIQVEVKLPSPLPIPLSEFGVQIKDLAAQFNTLPEYDLLQKETAGYRSKARLAIERAEHLEKEQKVAEEEAKLRKIEGIGKAEAELAVLRAKQQISPMISFIEKWNGKLPEVLAGLGATESVVSDLIASRIVDRQNRNASPPGDQKKD